MAFFVLGLVLFFGLHLFSAFRTRTPEINLRLRMGEPLYMGLYSVFALIGFVLIIYGYGETRGMGLVYSPPVALQHLNSLFMLPALILLVASQIPAGHIKRTVKHPMLLAVKLWAAGHLLANGELNSVILFGSFLAFAIVDRIMVKRRGDDGPGRFAELSWSMDAICVVIGIGLFAAVAFWLHPILFGVQAIPMS